MITKPVLLPLILIVLFSIMLTTLVAQTAQIIENIVPAVPYMVKQGADGNIYLTAYRQQGTESLPFFYRGYGILSPQGEILQYTDSDFGALETELGWNMNYAFCVDPDSTFRIPYFHNEGYGAEAYTAFKWCTYNRQTGHTFQEGFHTGHHYPIENVFQLNADKWIIIEHINEDSRMATCVNATGDSLWNYPIYGSVDCLKRISDNTMIYSNRNEENYGIHIINQNGHEVWNYSSYGFSGHVMWLNVIEGAEPETAIIAHGECSSFTYFQKYQNGAVTDLFNTNALFVPFYGAPDMLADGNGILISVPVVMSFYKFDYQGNLLWQYALPESLNVPLPFYQISKSMADSNYVAIGLRNLGYDEVEQLYNYSPYLVRLPFDIVSNEDEHMPIPENKITTYPNPFRDKLTLSFETKTPQPVEISVYNIKGQLVRKLHTYQAKAGQNRFAWDGCDSGGRHICSGLYFIQVKIDSQTMTRKCLCLSK